MFEGVEFPALCLSKLLPLGSLTPHFKPDLGWKLNSCDQLERELFFWLQFCALYPIRFTGFDLQPGLNQPVLCILLLSGKISGM